MAWSTGQKQAFGADMGLGIFSALMSARAAGAEAVAARIQFEEEELNRQLTNQVQNRNIANDNAAIWMSNQRIEETTNTALAEEQFWINYNFDNATSHHGSQTQAVADSLITTYGNKNISSRSGTAQAMLRMAMKNATDGAVDLRIDAANKAVTAERKRDQALAGRNYGYNDQIPFTPAKYGGPSPQAAYNMALASGIVQTASRGAGMAFGAA